MIDEFTHQVDCDFKGERYSVRDNGAIMRHPGTAGRRRPVDNIWTFGKPNDRTGYLEISSVRVHSVVATAFNGLAPTKDHVVDHIDTNRKNNRPGNLRWVTRLENILLNEITAKRIAMVCGSVEDFLADPSKFRDKFPDPNYAWMCAVSVEEAQSSLQRMRAWAKNDNIPSGGSLGMWIYNRGISDLPTEPVREVITTQAITINAVQRNWSVPSEFPCCPDYYEGHPLRAYSEALQSGTVFCSNNIYTSVVEKYVLSDDQQTLYIMTRCEGGIKPWAIAKVTFEDHMFVHTSVGSYFEKNGAEKYYCLEQGLEWTGGDSIDDYC